MSPAFLLSHVFPVFPLSHVFPPRYPTIISSPGPSCGWVTPMAVRRVALGADGAPVPVPTEPFQHQAHTETLLERLQGHGGRRQSGVDSGRDQGARGADELGDTEVMPLSPPLPAEPTKHNLWHLGEQGELAHPWHWCGRWRDWLGAVGGILGAPSTNLCFSLSRLAGLKVRPGVMGWGARCLA